MKATELQKKEMKLYYINNKEEAQKRMKKRYEEKKDEINKKARKDRKENRERWRVYELKAKKKWRKTNPLILKTESLRRKTARLFPVKNKICEICKKNKAVHHHHNTLPYEYTQFIFVCHRCHLKEDKKLLGGKNAYSYMER